MGKIPFGLKLLRENNIKTGLITAKFDLTKKEEQEKCFHYTNLQPLWACDNLMKGSRYDQ